MNKFTHRFEPMRTDQRFCGVLLPGKTAGNKEYGYVGCGYPRSMHMGCQEPTCPDYGDPDFGQGTCPEDHVEPR